MMTTARALRRSESLSQPLPEIWEMAALYSLGFKPRKGELIIVGGRSGAAKSSFMIWLAVRWALPCLYYSLDQNLYESTYRALAAQTGKTIDEVEQILHAGAQPPAGAHEKFWWCFEKNPTLTDLQGELDAYAEANDAYPEIIVVDNLIDVFHGREGDKNGYDDALKFLKEKASETGATVFVLAHSSNAVGSDPFKPQPKRALLDQPDKHPQGILMVALNPNTGEFRVSNGKSRLTLSDATGESFASLKADQARCTFAPWSYHMGFAA